MENPVLLGTPTGSVNRQTTFVRLSRPARQMGNGNLNPGTNVHPSIRFAQKDRNNEVLSLFLLSPLLAFSWPVQTFQPSLTVLLFRTTATMSSIYCVRSPMNQNRPTLLHSITALASPEPPPVPWYLSTKGNSL